MGVHMRAGLVLAFGMAAVLAGCGGRQEMEATTSASSYAGATPRMMALVEEYADYHDIPAELLHRVIQRESGYNPAARNGPYWGLMQILPETASTMGFRGAPSDLLDAETNLRYAGAYLRGAWIVSDGDIDEAVGWYARGYYFEARDRCLLVETGLRDEELRC
jgi:soluble lytic murein transglycosylase-like protein